MGIKVSVVEDDRRVRESLVILLSDTDGFSCLSAFPNAEEALKRLPLAWPDVLLMDINLPGMSGIECAAKLRTGRPSLPIIMLTVYAENDKIFKSLLAGASGYLIKQAPPAEILEAIAEVHRGGSPMSSDIACKVVDYVRQSHQASGMVPGLSKQEHDILACLSKGYQYQEIAEALSLSIPTVRTRLRKIYTLLHAHSQHEDDVGLLETSRS
jgi:DNA-binding NarL/FixJ family response regulator